MSKDLNQCNFIGRLGKDKACNKKDVTENRKDKIEYYRSPDSADERIGRITLT